MNYRYVAIEGNIGAGKTALATMFAKKYNAEIILEEFIDNQFLPKFYNDPAEYAFPLEVSFLIDRFRQIKNLTFSEENGTQYFADYFFDKSLVFSGINLKEDVFELFHDLYSILAIQLPQPEIVLYLHNTAENLQENIVKRGRFFEAGIQNNYLQKIEEGYRSYLEMVDFIPVIYINLQSKDFVADEKYFEELNTILQQNWQPGLHFEEL